MLPKSKRLNTAEFLSVMDKGKLFNSLFFVTRLTYHNKDTKISAVAPKKVAKNAVKRNSIRRKIYGVIKDFYPSLVMGTHIIIFAKTTMRDKKYVDIKKDIENIFVKAGILKYT